MRILTRKKIGILLAVLPTLVFVVFALADVRLVTMSSRHFEATGATASSVQLHWPVVLPAGMFIAGIIVAFLPRS